MRFLISISLSLLFSGVVFSQNDSIHAKRHQLVYLEIGGPSTIASINYEIGILQYNRLQLNARLGLGSTRFKDFQLKFNPDLTIPLGINAMLLLADRNKGTLNMEFMGGNTFSTYVKANSNFHPHRESSNHGYLTIGPNWTFNTGFYTRLSYCLVFEYYHRAIHWGGLSLGYQFI